VEGDEVAVLAFKLQDWFKVYKEQEKVRGSRAVLCYAPMHVRLHYLTVHTTKQAAADFWQCCAVPAAAG
jgi:hypothetical protein